MSLNEYMHPRNIYKSKPDYKKLGEKYPQFKQVLTYYPDGKAKIDFNNPDSLRMLTTTLLQNDFNLNVNLPLNRLIPAIPQRLNYLLWIEDLVTLFDYPKHTQINGIDIGTGPGCIFPLLGVALNKNWRFVATEVDDYSFKYALDNVASNSFQSLINVIKVGPNIIINQDIVDQMPHPIHFLMCNPPFFGESYDNQMNTDENGFKQIKRPPSTANTSSPIESITEGGETQFVVKMFQESLNLKEQIKIFTVMLGKKKSLNRLKQELTQCSEVRNLIHTEFCQGMTKRWGLAWTFDDRIKLISTTIALPTRKKKVLPLTLQVPINLKWINLKTVFEALMQWMKIELDIYQIEIISQGRHRIVLEVKTNTNTWTHQRRKRRAHKQAGSKMDHNMEDNESVERIKRKYSEQEDMEVDSVPIQHCTLDDHNSKKMKEQKVIMSKDEERYLLHCGLILSQKDDLIEIEMKTKEKAKSKETVHQLYQFFKNKF